MASSVKKTQHGGFALGMVVGLLVGLALAMGVALYVTKVPIPFVDKVPQRSTEQDAAEAEKNKHWDPNAPLATKAPAHAASEPPATTGVPSIIPSAPPVAVPASAAVSPTAPSTVPPTAAASGKPAASAAGAAALQFFVQVGAYARSDDAEQQRAKLGLSGLVGRISEREQAGKLVYRVRLGPFDARDEADTVRDQAAAAGFPDATLVRVPRAP